MSRPYPILLMLAMSLPGAVRALGLGDIRVDSALNEPLSAQIDIVGATRDELAALTAKVANHELFQKYGADRPSFLSSATFKVGMDAQGRPVLNVRSTDAFTDPVVSLVVDLRWGRNEVVREYPLLLDPAGFAAVRQAAENAVAVAGKVAGAGSEAPVAPTASTYAVHVKASARKAAATALPTALPLHAATVDTASADVASSGTTSGLVHKVAAGETLHSIARHNGARSEAQIQRMIIATFRANPHAFEGNINRLRSGAILTLPTAAETASLSSAEVRRDVRSQMIAWRLDGRPAATRALVSQSAAQPAIASHPVSAITALQPAAHSATAAVGVATPPLAAALPANVASPATTVAAATAAAAADPADAVLKSRVQSLEHALDDMNKQLANENVKIRDLHQEAAEAAARSEKTPSAASVVVHAVPPVAAAPTSHAESSSAIFGPVAATLALLVAGFAYIRRRLTPRSDSGTAMVESALATVSAPMEAPLADVAAPVVKPPVLREAPPVAAPQRAVPPAPVAQPMKLAQANDFVSASETTSSLEIDIEALERSYLDSMSMEAATESPTVKTVAVASADTATVAVDPLDLDATLMKGDLHTAVIDTQGLSLDAARMVVDRTNLDYNLLDLDATTSQHVHMSSDLLSHPVTQERRTNIVDVLKMAIERDPQRLDLRLKLLETYYIAATSNQRSFMDVVRKLARERQSLSAEEWNKVQMMGKEIAADDILFVDPPSGKLADCA